MSVGFYSGTSTGPNDLIDKLRLAAIDQSWTIDAFTAVGAGYRLHMHKTLGGEASYFNFRSAIAERGTTLITEDNNDDATYGVVTGLIVNGSTGYDAGEVWHKQTGYPQNPSNSNKSYGSVITPMSISAIPSYYFFFVGNSIHIAVEITSGIFQFISCGMLYKAGAYTGGQYFTGSIGSRMPYSDYISYYDDSRWGPRYFSLQYEGSGLRSPNGSVYLDVDSVADWRVADSYSREIAFPCPAGQSYAGIDITASGLVPFFYSKSPNAYNAMSAMTPIYLAVKRSDGNYSPIGWPEGVRFLNVTNYTPGQEITYGSETWIVFPANSYASSVTIAYPGMGFAFLKDDGS